LRRSPLAGADLNPTSENRWEVLFKNGPRASDDFLNEREQPPAEERESL
jgi:virulence-associated protein VagC